MHTAMCIQLVIVTVCPLHTPHLHPLPDLSLSLVVKFVPCLNCAFSLYTDPVTPSLGTRNGAKTNDSDRTTEYTFGCLCDELKRAVDESRSLDDAKQILSELNCSQDDFAGSQNPSIPIYIFNLPAHLTYNLQNL